MMMMMMMMMIVMIIMLQRCYKDTSEPGWPDIIFNAIEVQPPQSSHYVEISFLATAVKYSRVT